MKRLIFIAILGLGCRNKKAELVDLEIRLKDSLQHATIRWQQQAAELNLPTKEAVARDQTNAMKMNAFQKSIDSVEMELKKY